MRQHLLSIDRDVKALSALGHAHQAPLVREFPCFLTPRLETHDLICI